MEKLEAYILDNKGTEFIDMLKENGFSYDQGMGKILSTEDAWQSYQEYKIVGRIIGNQPAFLLLEKPTKGHHSTCHNKGISKLRKLAQEFDIS